MSDEKMSDETMSDDQSQDPRTPDWFDRQHQLWGVVSGYATNLPPSEAVRHLGLFETPVTVARYLWFAHLYEQILDVPGSIHEYGVFYGRDIVIWECLREIYEANMSGTYREIIGFDTFAGHRGSNPEYDGKSKNVADGAFAVGEGWLDSFTGYLNARRERLPTPSIQFVSGDVRDTVPAFFTNRPGENVALAYLDLDLYEPTKAVLVELEASMRPGSIIAFDELGAAMYPGESRAVNEVFPDARIHKYRYGDWSYLVIGE